MQLISGTSLETCTLDRGVLVTECLKLFQNSGILSMHLALDLEFFLPIVSH